MRLLFAVTSAVFIASCTSTQSSKPNGGTTEAVNMRDGACKDYPVNKESDLEVFDVKLPTVSSIPFVAASVIDRRNVLNHMLVPFDGTDVAREKATPIIIGKNSTLFGMLESNKRRALIIANTVKERTTLEVRSLQDNKVLAKSSFVLDGKPTDVMMNGGNGLFGMTISVGEYERHFVSLSEKKGVWSFEKIRTPEVSKLAKLLFDSKAQSLRLTDVKAGRDKIEVQSSLVKGADLTQASTLNIDKLSSSVESLQFSIHDGTIVIGALVGDSMVGQASLLWVEIGFDQQSKMNQKIRSELPLKDYHLTEPTFFMTADKAPGFLLIQWLTDNPEAIAVRMSKAKVLEKEVLGVLPKGSAILEVSNLNGRTQSLVRQKSKDQTQFLTCEWKI